MAFVQGATNTVGTSVSSLAITFASPVTSGNCVWGTATCDSAAGSTMTVTDDKGNSYAIKDTITDGPGAQTLVSFVLGNITNGPTTITVTVSPANDFVGIQAIEESGILAATDPTDGHTAQLQLSVAAGSNTLTSGNFTTTVNGDRICGGAVCTHGTSSLNPGTSPITMTIRENDGLGNLDYFAEDGTQTTASASTAATFSPVSGTTGWIVAAMALKPAAVGTPIVVGQTPRRIFVPGKGPDRGLRSPKAFPSSSAVLTLSATQGTYTLTGQAQTLAVGMPASQGTYSLTGQAQTLGVGMPAGQGTYSLTGFAATLSVVPNPVGRTTPRIFRPDSGPHLNLNRPKAFPTTGGPVTFTLAAGQGTYTLNGISQTLLRGIQIVAGQGTYTLTGKPQTLNRTIQINAGQGTYTLTGKPQSFAFTMPATQGTYALTGQAQTLAVGMPAGQGTYALTGKPQSFAVALSLLAGQGTYSLTGIGQVLTFTPAGGASNPPHSNPFFATPGSLTSLP